MKWSDEKVYGELYDAICFDDDEERAIEILKKALADDTINVNQTDTEGLSLIHHAEMNCMDDLQELLRENGAIEED
jgi:ankyrin repeat protein